MLFIPYKADVDLGRWPIMTLLVCAACIWVFSRQALSEYRYEKELTYYCNHDITRDDVWLLRRLEGVGDKHFCNVLLEIRQAPDRSVAIRTLAQNATPIPFYPDPADSAAYLEDKLTDSFKRFDRTVPQNLTDELHYDPKHPTLGTMLTAAFSHGDAWHLISNLIFFFAFAASVEVITGYLYYGLFIVVTAIGTHLAYSYSVQGLDGALPTVGLSGVVMAMMAFLATIAPTLSIRCFFWLLIFVRTFRVPALALAALYILQNAFDYVNRDPNDNINYVAHLSGAALGVGMGLIYRIRHREFLREMLPGI